VYWKEHEKEFPILASLARDVLTIPASGSGVERLFNSARDICHYRRGSLKPQTIQDLMMFMCTARFDVESEQLSDNEADSLTIEDIRATQYSTTSVSERTLGKRRAEFISDSLIQLDDTNEVPLPDNNYLLEESSTQRRSSGRVPKRSRRDEDYVYN
jgi:hypothetical protein